MGLAPNNTRNEVWSIDQSDSAGKNYGGTIYIWDSKDLERVNKGLDPGATIDLVNCTTPNGVACQLADVRPDNAPICPIIESTGVLNFVTLRGGGLFVIDATSTPMRIVAEYDKSTIHPNGCLGAQVGNKMYVDSGGGTMNNLSEADLYAFPLGPGLYSPLNGVNIPMPKTVFSEDVEGADSHGAALTKHNSYLWVADRGRNII
jgi:hypothetical protein